MATLIAYLCTNNTFKIELSRVLILSRYLQGKTKDQAFRIGNDIADTVTALNPSPVKLKFEKASKWSVQ